MRGFTSMLIKYENDIPKLCLKRTLVYIIGFFFFWPISMLIKFDNDAP